MSKISLLKKYIYDYNKGINNISDEDYEVFKTQLINKGYFLKEEIDELENNIRFTKKDYITHIQKIKRIDKIYHILELTEYFKKIKYNKKVLFEPKIDGIMVVVTYENHILETAITRGNLFSGEDITKVLSFLLPKKISISTRFTLIGELHMTIDIYNSSYLKFKTPRHALMSIIMNNKLNDNIYNDLKFIVYNASDSTKNNFNTQEDLYLFIESLNFTVIPRIIIDDINTISNITEESIYEICKQKKYFIDGIILKVLDIEDQRKIDKHYVNTHKYIIAIKKTNSFTSKVKNIYFSTGKNGVIVPIIEIEKVIHNSIEYRNVSLYSIGQYLHHNIHVDNTVILIYSGILVFYKNVDIDSNINNCCIDNIVCSLCNEKISYNGKNGFCINDLCKGKVINTTLEFFKQVGIKKFGKKIATMLVLNDIIIYPEDIFDMEAIKYKYLICRDKKIIKKVDKNLDYIIDNFNKEKNNIKIEKYILLMGIPDISCYTFYKIFQNKESRMNFINFNFDKISEINSKQIISLNKFILKKINICRLQKCFDLYNLKY